MPESAGGPAERHQRTRWLANAEADHGGAMPRRRAAARTTRRRSCGREGVDARGPRRGDGARPSKDGPRAGGGGHVLRRSLRSLRSVIRRQDPPATGCRPRSQRQQVGRPAARSKRAASSRTRSTSSGGSWTSKSTPSMPTRTASQSSESSLVRSSHVRSSIGLDGRPGEERALGHLVGRREEGDAGLVARRRA